MQQLATCNACSNLQLAIHAAIIYIGVSLSEPHVGVTALHMRVCMLACLDRLLTVNFKSAHLKKDEGPQTYAFRFSFASVDDYCQTVALVGKRL